MAGRYNEQGGSPFPAGRNPGGAAHRDGPFAEHREDPRIPFETRRDHVRRDREGDGPAAAGGQHRDAGAPSAEVGRQAGHQEGRQRASRALVPAQRPLVRDPRTDRPRGAVEDRADRGEPEEAQGFRVARRVRTPFSVPARTTSAPSRGTSFDSSTITTNFRDAAATIFSRNRAPPRPLMRLSFGSTSSAPSTHRSSRGCSSSEVSGIPRRFAASAVAKDVGTPRRSVPPATSRATPSRKCRAVEPVPSPRTMPPFTYFSAASAARRFMSSADGTSGPPANSSRGYGTIEPHVAAIVGRAIKGSRPPLKC